MLPVDLLLRLQALGGEVCVESGTLQLSVPWESLEPDLVEELRAQEGQLVQLLTEMSRTAGAAAPALAPRDPAAELPLSFAQERFWLLSQFDQDSAAYNLVFAVRLGGALDIEALRLSLGDIVARHEVLRTEVRMEGDRAVQSIAAAGDLELVAEDVAVTGDVEEAVSRLVKEQEQAKPVKEEAGVKAKVLKVLETGISVK